MADLEHRTAYWTHDDEAAEHVGHLYYFAPSNRRPPPYLKQIHVDAIIDIADDGTLAGVELIDNMPPPLADTPAPEQGREDVVSGSEVVRRCYECGTVFSASTSCPMCNPNHATVDRVWKALGIASYEEAGGKEISQIIADRCEALRAAEARMAAAAKELQDDIGEWGRKQALAILTGTGEPAPADEPGAYYPKVIEYPEASRVEFILRDTGAVCDHGEHYDILRDMHTQEIIGFAWPIGTNPALAPSREPTPAPSVGRIDHNLGWWYGKVQNWLLNDEPLPKGQPDGGTLAMAIKAAREALVPAPSSAVGEAIVKRMATALETAYDDVNDDAVAKLIDEALVEYKHALSSLSTGTKDEGA